MNYIAEINRFHELLPQSRMTPSSIALWYGLMHIFNKAGWPDEKTVSLYQLKQDTKLSKASIYRERVRLQNEGLITFVAGSGSRPCTFRMLSLSKELASQIGTLEFHSETPQPSKNNALESQIEPPLSQIETPASSIPYKEDINLFKQDKIEINKRKSGSSSSPKSEQTVKTSSKSKKEKSSAQKEKHTGRSKLDLERWLATVDEPWQGLMRQWLEYKILRRERYKTELGVRKCLTLMQNLSGNDPKVAQMIIDQSIASNYAGLFPLKRGYGQIPTPHGGGGTPASRTETPQYGQRIGQITQPEDEAKRQRLLERFRETVYDPEKNKH
jgi:hypothetical protein